MRHGGRWWFPALLALMPAAGSGDALPVAPDDLLAGASLRADADSDGVPDGWKAVRGPGFRAFPGSIRIEEGRFLRLLMNGRSVGVETIQPLPVREGSTYRLEGRFRTEGLRNGEPEACLRWLDAGGREVAAERRVLGRATDWTGFVLEDVAVPDRAAALAVRLGVRGTEVHGRVWFDAARLSRSPGLVLEGLPPGHLVLLPGPAALTLRLGGLDAGPYRVEGSLTDMDGRVCWRWEQSLDLPQGESRLAVPMALPGEGAFRAVFSLAAPSGTVALRRTCIHAISDLPPAAGGADAGGDAVGMPGIRVEPGPAAPGAQAFLLERLRPAAAILEVATLRGGNAASAWGTRPSDLLLRRLGRLGVHCAGLLEPPAEAGGDLSPEAFRATVLRHAGAIDTWILRPAPSATREGLLAAWKDIEGWVGTLPRPVRWGLMPAPGGALPAGPPFQVALHPDGGPPAGPGGMEVWRLDRLAEGEGTRPDLRAFSVRALRELMAGRSVFLPLDAKPGGLLRADGAARPEFLAWRTLSHVLKGARSLGPIPLDPRLEAYALRQGGQTVILAWTREAGGEAEVSLPSTHPVTRLGLTGLSEILEPEGGRVTLRVGDLPCCLLSVSSGWLRTRTTLRLDGPVVASRRPSLRTLSFENGFDVPLAGSLRILPPPGWRAVPSVLSVSVGPGGTFSAPVQLFPGSYEVTAGRLRRLDVELTFDEGGMAPMAASVPLDLAPPEIESRVSSVYEPAGELLVVSQLVVNRGSGSVLCDAFLSARGRVEESRPLGRLKPGEMRHVQYVLPWRAALEGEVLVGAREMEGARRFTIGGLRGE